MIAAAIASEAGDKAQVEQARAWLIQHAPALAKNIRQELTYRLGRPADVELLLSSLRKAGLDVGA